MDVQTEIQAFVRQFEAEADDDYKTGMRTVAHTERVMYGVRVPQLRAIAKGWCQVHPEIERADLLSIIEALWAGQSREEQALALELLRRHPHQIPALHWNHFDRWRQHLDGWELTDVLGVHIFGRWMLADPIDRLPYLQLLIHEDDLWSRRLAIVSTVWLNRSQKDLSFPSLTLDLLDRVKVEREPMITKAISWALRELTKKHPDRVADYVDANDGVLAAHVLREVRNKLRTGVKSGKS